jgi:hypothetical protein
VRPWYTDAGSGINGLVPIGAEDVKRQTMSVPSRYQKAAYEHLRAAHLNAVRASLEDHVARLEWSPEQIERYRTERLRSLLTSPASARRSTPPGWPISTQPQPDVPAVSAALAVSLARYLLSNPELSISIVDEIPRHASTGKLKRFIPLSG